MYWLNRVETSVGYTQPLFPSAASMPPCTRSWPKLPLSAAVAFGAMVLVPAPSVVWSVSVAVPTVPLVMIPLLLFVMFAAVEQSSCTA